MKMKSYTVLIFFQRRLSHTHDVYPLCATFHPDERQRSLKHTLTVESRTIPLVLPTIPPLPVEDEPASAIAEDSSTHHRH
jgi:hypothetical protein